MNSLLKIEFWNTCDIVDDSYKIIYQNEYTQYFYVDADLLRPRYEDTLSGGDDGRGEFIQTTGFLQKRFEINCGIVPGWFVDLLFNMALHDNIQVYDKDGLVYTAQDLDIEFEWIDECYATARLIIYTDSLFSTAC